VGITAEPVTLRWSVEKLKLWIVMAIWKMIRQAIKRVATKAQKDIQAKQETIDKI